MINYLNVLYTLCGYEVCRGPLQYGHAIEGVLQNSRFSKAQHRHSIQKSTPRPLGMQTYT